MKKHCESEKRFGKEGDDGAASKGLPLRIRLMMVREGPAGAAAVERPSDVFDFMRDKAVGLDREQFWRIDLDARNRVLGYEVVSVGTLTASLVHPREVFKGALLNNAVSIVIAHNHPSGESRPSPEDKETTRRLQKAGELLGVPVVDHVILTDGGYFSFREGGIL